jgi:alpha-glucosidase (family GH31 glycosyl hydrolase)
MKDYMSKYKLFTWNETHYPVNKVKAFTTELHNKGQKYVVIIDPGVKVEQGYEAYDLGLRGIIKFENIRENFHN